MKYVFSLLALFYIHIGIAQQQVDAEIKAATVYRNNAQLSSTASVKLPAGTSEIILRNISTSIQPSSLQVALKSSGNVRLLSAVYERDYINQHQLNDKQIALKSDLEKLTDDLNWIKKQKEMYIDLEEVLKQNNKLGGQDIGLNPEDLNQLLDIYKTKQLEYAKALLELSKKEKDVTEQKNKVQQQLNEENTKFNKPSGVIKLQVSSVSPTTSTFAIDYLIKNAGWTPVYDLRSEGTDKSVELVYKANIYQNSGYDWNRINLRISTGNPSRNNNRPILYPLFANFYNMNINNVYKKSSGAPQLDRVTMNMETAVVEEIEEEFTDGFAYDATEENSTLSTQYEVALPQSIPSDGKAHLVGLSSYTLSSEYQYQTIPKRDKATFLLAKVSDWGSYNLQPGKANIFFEGAYIGESYINPNSSKDTLLLSLGRDNGIKIDRKELVDFTKVKSIGNNIVETYTYEIELRNNNRKVVSLEVLDQIPVSKQKEITVSLEESSGAKLNDETGILTWNVNLEPNQSKKVRFTYTIKYPKDKPITGKK